MWENLHKYCTHIFTQLYSIRTYGKLIRYRRQFRIITFKNSTRWCCFAQIALYSSANTCRTLPASLWAGDILPVFADNRSNLSKGDINIDLWMSFIAQYVVLGISKWTTLGLFQIKYSTYHPSTKEKEWVKITKINLAPECLQSARKFGVGVEKRNTIYKNTQKKLFWFMTLSLYCNCM